MIVFMCSLWTYNNRVRLVYLVYSFVQQYSVQPLLSKE